MIQIFRVVSGEVLFVIFIGKLGVFLGIFLWKYIYTLVPKQGFEEQSSTKKLEKMSQKLILYQTDSLSKNGTIRSESIWVDFITQLSYTGDYNCKIDN